MQIDHPARDSGRLGDYAEVMAHCIDTSACPAGVLDIFAKSTIPLSLADSDREDQPLIAINDPFCTATGYTPADALGRNCRFLQPPTGVGPVRARMRDFCHDDAEEAGRFVIANETKSGKPFLNVVYLAKLRHSSGRRLILGSQFAIGVWPGREEIYDRVLREDMYSIAGALAGNDWAMIGSMDAIANTASLLARHRLESEGFSHGKG